MNISQLISNISLEEKVAIVAGVDGMFTCAVPRLGIPSLSFADGPNGLRKIKGDIGGVHESEKATAFPCAVTVASSWNGENAYMLGKAVGEECKRYGVHLLLGPGVNIKRNPRGGRNFEYYSEDPTLSAVMGENMVDGVQSTGVGVALKHFALNNSENYRIMGDSRCDMRAIREIYLKAFERIVKKSKPTSLMCAYNKVNGTFCSENKWLLKKVLREEWGYDGLVMSDWGAVRDRIAGIKGGLDLEMPGESTYCRKKIMDGVKEGKIAEKELDECVENVLRLIEKTYSVETENVDFEAHHILAGEIAEDCAVLMKNDGSLPLEKDKTVCVVGELFEKMRYQGAGSSQINPTAVTTPRDSFEENGVSYVYAKGYKADREDVDDELLDEALETCATYQKVVVFAGLTDRQESEGVDRANLSLPNNQLALIDALVDTGVKIVLVLFGGGVVELGFEGGVSSILNMFLPGQNGGSATYNLLFGEINPSGKLSESWVKSEKNVPFNDKFGQNAVEVYKESVFVGYRYYMGRGEVAFPFGHGLSYTTFIYSDIKVEDKGDRFIVSCSIRNTGARRGAEVVQLYVHNPKSEVFKPEAELRGFNKVYLDVGEERRVEIEVEKEELRYFNIDQNRWVYEVGEYEFRICSSSEKVELRASVYESEGEVVSSPYCEKVNNVYKNLDLDRVTDEVFESMSGVKIPKEEKHKPFTTETRVEYLQEGVIGKVIYKGIMKYMRKDLEKAKLMPDGVEKDNAIKAIEFGITSVRTGSLRLMSMCSTKLPFNIAEGVVALANWRFLRAIRKFAFPIKSPDLPSKKKNNKKF